MINPQISLHQARKIALRAQLLAIMTGLPSGKEGVARTIEKLGYVQIDPLVVVERAHHHTLWSRLPDYDPEMLHELQSRERRIFEYWGHALSYFPMSEYRYCLPRMRNFQDPASHWAQYVLGKSGHLMEPFLERLRKEGPLTQKDFTTSSQTNSEGFDSEAAKGALDLLFWKGDIMVRERRNFRRVFDLTERVLPKGMDTTMPEEDELGRFFVRRALSAFGVAQEKEICIFMQPESARDVHMQAAGKAVIAKSLAELIETGEVVPVRINEDRDTDYYALAETVEKVDASAGNASDVFLLSPFDNLITQRERTKRLFGFDYVLECYTPAVKRKYGYFVLPILWGDHFVGRLDPKADRKKMTLIVHNLYFESEFKAFDEFLPVFAKKLQSFARFNQCEEIRLENTSPGSVKPTTEQFLKETAQT